MVNTELFQEATDQTNTTDPNMDLFQTDTMSEDTVVSVSEAYLSDIAERWAARTLSSYSDMLQVVKNVGPNGVLNQPEPPADGSKIIDYGFTNNLSSEELIQIYQEKSQVDKFKAQAKHNKDLIETVVDSKDTPWRQRTTDAKIAYFHGKVRDELNALNSDSTILGSAFDILGMLGWESTFGMVARGTGSRKTTAEDFYQKVIGTTSPEEVDAIVKEAIKEGYNRSFFGNKLQATIAADAAMLGGVNVNDGPAFLLDVGTIAAGPLLKGITKGVTSSSKLTSSLLAADSVDIAAISSLDAADSALAFSIYNNTQGVQLARNGSLAATRVGVTNPLNSVSPSSVPVLVHAQENYILKNIVGSHFGSGVDKKLLDEYANTVSQRVAKDLNLSYRGHTVKDMDELGTNKIVQIQLGKEDGKVFTTLSSAEKAAKKVYGKVLKIPDRDEYVVILDKNLATKGMSEITEESDLYYTMFHQIVSPDVISKQANMTLAKQGEARLNYILGGMKPYKKAMRDIAGGKFKIDRQRLSTFMNELSSSGRNRAYTRVEFQNEWAAKYGTPPDPKVTEAYIQTTYLNDARWLLASDVQQRRLTEAGVEVVNFSNHGEIKVIPDTVKAINGSPSEVFVRNMSDGSVMTLGDARKAKVPLYSVAEDLVDDQGRVIEYVTGNISNKRIVTKYDALPYNPGGVRESKFDYFVKMSTKGVNLADQPVNLMPRLIYATGSEASAASAVRELNTIIGKIKSLTNGADLRTFLSGARATLTKDAENEINALITANNNFNPSIENLDDFLKMSQDTGLDWFSPLSIGKKNQTIGDVGGLNNKIITRESTHSDVYKYQHNVYGDKYKTLTPYGENDFVIDPIRATERDFLRNINEKGQAEYLKTSIEGLVAGAEKNGIILNSSVDSLKKGSINQQIMDLKIDTSTTLGKKYEAVRRTLVRKVEEKSNSLKFYQNFINSLQERVFDKGIFGLGKGKRWDVWDKFNTDPIVALRGWAFDQKLGMLAIDQLVVQSSQIPNILAISPKHGLAALMDVPALRIALASNRADVVEQMSKNIAKNGGKVQAKYFDELVYYTKKSGRTNIGSSVAEFDGAASIAYGTVQRAREGSRVFFNEGEKLSRIMAIATAFREWKAANPTLSVLTKEGMASADSYIIARGDALTSHMTSVSPAAWQKGFLSLGTQFTGFMARNLEQAIFARTITPAERNRLIAAQVIMYGASSIGLGWAVDSYIYNTNTEVDPDTYTATKYGLLDYTLSTLLDSATSASERFSIFGGVYDKLEQAASGNFAEVVTGPVGQTVVDTGSDLWKVLFGLATGKPSAMSIDAYKLGQNFSGLSKISKSWLIHNTGEIYTKDGRLKANGLTSADAALILAGAKLQVESVSWDAISLKNGEATYIKESSSQIRQLRSQGMKYLEEGRDKEGIELFRQASDIETTFNTYQLEESRKLSREYNVSLTESLIKKLRDGYRDAYANLLENISNKGNQ